MSTPQCSIPGGPTTCPPLSFRPRASGVKATCTWTCSIPRPSAQSGAQARAARRRRLRRQCARHAAPTQRWWRDCRRRRPESGRVSKRHAVFDLAQLLLNALCADVGIEHLQRNSPPSPRLTVVNQLDALSRLQSIHFFRECSFDFLARNVHAIWLGEDAPNQQANQPQWQCHGSERQNARAPSSIACRSP
jgi:hypothetical protein